MRELSLYRLIAASGLLLILSMPMAIQGLHPWLDEHEVQAHCDTNRGQIHIHDRSYAFDHCFLCAFHFSQYTDQFTPAARTVPGWMELVLPISGHLLLVKAAVSVQTSRGPPALS